MKCTYASTRALEQLYADVAGRAFARFNPGDYRGRSRHARSGQRYERLLIDDGTVVAGALLMGFDLRYGETTIRSGGVGDVVTDPDCQGKGYGRTLFEHVVEFMTDEGFHVSQLFGIPNYYHKYNYVTALRSSSISLGVLGLDVKPDPAIEMRPATLDDLPLLTDLYDGSIGRYPLSMVRVDHDWQWLFEHQGFDESCHLVMRDGEPFASVVLDNSKRRIEEICMRPGTPKEWYDGVLSVIFEYAKERFMLSLQLDAPTDDSLAKHCLLRHEVRWEIKAEWNRGPMFRIINLGPLFEQIAGELAKNWRERPRSVKPASFTIACPLGDVGFDATESALEVVPGRRIGEIVELPTEAVTELVCAFRNAKEILPDAGFNGSTAVARALGGVFPERVTFQSYADHY